MRIADLRGSPRFESSKMAKVSLFESPRMFCDLYCLEPGQSQKAHAHAGSDKIYVVMRGQGSFVVGEETTDLGEGMALMAPAGISHGVTNSTRERLVVLVFMAPPPS